MDSGEKILIIDDDPGVLDSFAEWFELQGYDVLTAEGGQQGVKLAQEYQPDVIVCDFSMPEVDGLSVLEALRSNSETAEIPFVMFSAYDNFILEARSLLKGADACLDKSLGVEELLETVQRVLHA